MKWSLATRHQILLEITNAVISKTTNRDFFKALTTELKKHIPCDRVSINLYNQKKQSLQYFTEADGIDPNSISQMDRRPIKGSIAKMAIESRNPVIIDDLTQYSDLSIIGQLIKAGLRSTMAFPLIVRKNVLGTLHFSFKTPPDHLSELSNLLVEVSKQVAIAVDNLEAYKRLKDEKRHLEREKRYLIGVSEEYKAENFYYISPEMAEIMNLVKRVAKIDAPVLITGETGTGKDFLARYIHHISPRKNHMFIKVNCPTIPSTLFESELFGHAKGAFTGAASHRVGRFEMGDKGTVFLDEIGELPAGLQAKLLQVLQERRFERVGDNRPINVNFRLIAATNRDPEKSMQQGKLRKDLYYRLNIIRIHVPALRHRKEDIPLLVEKITRNEAALIHQPEPIYTQPALDLLSAYHWPGNVRELKNLVKRMIILKPSEKIHLNDVEKMIDLKKRSDAVDEISIPTLAESERHTIEQALIRCKGVIGGENGAARLLGVPRSTLKYRMNKYGIEPKKTVVLED
ncbi:MAG: sigma 54-interacting transcriptional regulator [Desulfobacteraceae bacterium]|jgi:formate hydrogenlyase transcriptional activator